MGHSIYKLRIELIFHYKILKKLQKILTRHQSATKQQNKNASSRKLEATLDKIKDINTKPKYI